MAFPREAAIEAVREGVGEHEIAAETYRAQFAAGSLYPALPLIIGSGRGSSFLHGTWMGVLSISESDPHILAPGMVFSIEPILAFYDQGWGAILGNCVLITETGRETLHKTPLDPIER